jgi:hypothetical protein
MGRAVAVSLTAMGGNEPMSRLTEEERRMSTTQTAINHLQGRDREAHVHEMALIVMTRRVILILAGNGCLHERVHSGCGVGYSGVPFSCACR